jgi:hypothetical protein
MYSCNMDAAERERGLQELTAAIQRSPNIQRLELTKLENVYLLPILDGLASNTGVKELTLAFDRAGLSLASFTSRYL